MIEYQLWFDFLYQNGGFVTGGINWFENWVAFSFTALMGRLVLFEKYLIEKLNGILGYCKVSTISFDFNLQA